MAAGGDPRKDQWSKPIGRRAVLSILGLGALGTVFGSRVQAGISSFLNSIHADGVASLLPGGGQFTIYTITNGYPAAPPDYKLRVDGLVQHGRWRSRPRTSSRFRRRASRVTSSASRAGSCLTSIGSECGSSTSPSTPGSIQRHRRSSFASFDGVYTESLTMEQARETGAIAAYSMLGGPVTREHGGPVRLYVPEMFGYKSIKWLSRIELVTHAQPGYWEQNGYPVDAWISGQAPRQPA